MANKRRRRRKKKNNNNLYKILAGAVGVTIVLLLGFFVAFLISESGIGFKKTPGIISEAKVLGTYEAAVTPPEWEMLEKNVPIEISQTVSIMMIGDMLMHLNVTESGYVGDGTRNYDHLFQRILPDIQQADISIVTKRLCSAVKI